MTLSHITAAEVRHQQREREREDRVRERERLNVNEKEKEGNHKRQREKEIGIFSMIGFDSATSSFLALLVNNSYRKN